VNAGVTEQTENQPRRRKPSAAKSWLKAIELTSGIEADPRRLFADLIEDWSERQPDCPGLISETETFSYRTLAERINRYARWALSAGIKAGDTVCLLMPSQPDYIAAWLGITKVASRHSSIPNWSGCRCRTVSTSPMPITSSSPTISERSLRPPCRI
jgi:fatty-acyl-CoA synthase